MNLTVNKKMGMPIHEQLFLQIKSQILMGEISAGTRLPSVRQMSDFIKVNRHTIARAYTDLEKEGLVETFASSGTFVKETVPAKQIEEPDPIDLQRLIMDTIKKANQMGYSNRQIVETVYSSILLEDAVKLKALFVECNPYALEQFISDIKKDLDIDISGCLLEDIQEDDQEHFKQYDLIMTTVGHYPELKMKLDGLNNIYALNIGPYLSVANQIKQLEPHSKVAIICVNKHGTDGLVSSLVDLGIPKKNLIPAEVSDPDKMSRAMSEADVLVVSNYAMSQSPELFKERNKHVIIYTNVLQRPSISMIHELIKMIRNKKNR